MAFVRWRGNCAQLLATITVEGRPRHQWLANLHGAYRTSPRLWAQIAAEFPTLVVDWAAVDRALALGPPTGIPPTPQQLTWADTAHQLSVWSTQPGHAAAEQQILAQAAEILTRWHSQRDR